MDNKQLQTWLKQHGFYQGNIDGIVGRQTKEALRKAQQYLADRGLYKVAVDGVFGKGTESAMTAYNKGKRYFNRYGVSFNIYDQASVENAFNQLKGKGVKKINMNGLTFDLNGKHGRHNFLTISRDMAAGKQSTFVGSQSDKRSQQADDGGGASFYRKAASRSSSSKASNGGGSSYNSNDLDHLVMRYAYDRFHGTEIDNSQWGITLGTDRFSGQKLVIDNRKYTPAQAAQIARGAGFSNYHYGGKRYDTNLFAGGSYRDRKDFDARIAAIQQSKGVKAAQDAYNAELSRQYSTYGIDFNMLTNKSGNQWTNLFGVVPYGYNASSVSALVYGQQAMHEDNAQVSGTTTAKTQYRYDPKTGHGRFKYNNFDEWYGGRMLGEVKYLNMNDGGIRGLRATTSTYMAGFPVDGRARKYIQFVGANPNKDTIDRTNFYTLAGDEDKARTTMNHNLFTDLTKNPAASYAYLQYIFGDRKKNWMGDMVTTNGRDFKIDVNQANKLAAAAGLDASKYHNNQSHFKYNNASGIGGYHDLWESLESFYLNGFDENGQLKKDFHYAEPGYATTYDGGAYTTVVRGGKPIRSEDYWNADIKGVGGGLNAGIGGKGLPLITRYNKNGGLLRHIIACGSGNKFTGNKKRGDKVDTEECAAWSNQTLRDLDYLISGNAWSLNGVDTIFNGYNKLQRPAEYSRVAVQRHNQEATDSVYRDFDSNSLDKSQPYVVNMFYKGSPAQERAYKEGKGVTGTHTGILSYQDGQWVVTHNIHGTIHEEPFVKLQNSRGKYGVTAIFSPRKRGVLNSIKSLFGLKYGGCIMPS